MFYASMQTDASWSLHGGVVKIQPENVMSLNLRALATLLFLSLMVPLAALAGGLPPCPVAKAVKCSENVALVSRDSPSGPSIWVHTKQRVTTEKLDAIKKMEGVAFATTYSDYLVAVERAPMVPENELVEKIYELLK